MGEDKIKIKGMYTCDVCSSNFPLIAEERYTVRGCRKGERTGGEGVSDGE